MPGSRLLSSLVFGMALVFAAAGCATDTQGESGSLSLDLVINGDTEIDEVKWTITRGGEVIKEGVINTSAPGATASVEAYGLEPGDGYTIMMEAVSTDGETTCKGKMMFSIEVGEVTKVHVMLNCKLPRQFGGVRVEGEFNICPVVRWVTVSPFETSVGNDIDLFAMATDEEGDPIAFMWSSNSGIIANPMADSTTYTCTEVRDDEITILVTDDGGTHCMDMHTVSVTCVAGDGEPDLCGDGNVDAGEECDDGNTDDGDGCSANCTIEVPPACGDGNVDAGEECDDGNTDDGDGCSATCTIEAEVVYEQDFNSLDIAASDALALDGWLVFGNVFDSNNNFLFGFGPFVAPNGGPGFSGIVDDQGGPEQEPQQLSVYSDYNCCQPSNGHFNGTDLVESVVFQEPRSAATPISAADLGKTFTFSFDAKNGDIQPPTTARAFIQTLDPSAGFNRTNFVEIDMTSIGTTWNRYTISLDLTDPLLEGQILQFGFSSTASNFTQSQNVYDNVLATLSPTP